MHRQHTAAASVFVCCISYLAVGAPPKVISTVPDHGATSVDASLTTIRVEFDQDMRTDRASWASMGTFPEITSPFRWTTPRVCILPVQLEAGQEYRIAINNAQARLFQNVAGESVASTPMWFQTKPANNDDPALRRLTPDDNRPAIAAMRRAVDERYSYRDLRVDDWDALFEDAHDDLLNADTAYRFAAVAGRMLTAADDLHVRVFAGRTQLPAASRSVHPNYNLAAVGRRLGNFKQRSKLVFSGTIGEDIGYICIASWDVRRRAELIGAFQALSEMSGQPNLIIDVRPNSGGSEPLASRFAGCFVREPVVYARHILRDSSRESGFTEMGERTLAPTKDLTLPEIDARTIVLMGERNMSSCEAFLLMMRQVPDCTLLGSQSYGSSGNPGPHALGNDVTVWLPRWQAMDAEGNQLEGVGIAPDVDATFPPAAFADDDPIFERAARLLRDGESD